MNCPRLVTAFLLPAALLFSRSAAPAQCCGAAGFSPWNKAVAGYPNAQLKIEFNYQGPNPAKIKYGSVVRELKVSSGSAASIPYAVGPTSEGGEPPMPGESPPAQMQNGDGNPYTGTTPGKLGSENKSSCSSEKPTDGSHPGDGKAENKNKEVGAEPVEDQQEDSGGQDGDSERPPNPTQEPPPQAPNDQGAGGNTPEMPALGSDPADSRGGGNSTNGGNMEGTPASPVDVPVRMAVAQKLGAFPNGKLQTGYILLRQPAVGTPAANPISLEEYVVRLGDDGGKVKLYWGTSWRLKVITTVAGTTIMTENDANRTMTFDFYNDDQVDWSGASVPQNPPAPYSGQVPIKQQILKMADPANKPPGNYNSGIITEVREHGVLQSTRTVWSSTVSSTYSTPYTSGNTVTSVNLSAPASQYRVTEDMFPSGASIWEEWSSVRASGSNERVVTVKQEYRRPSVLPVKAQKVTRYKLFDWGEEVIEERLVLDPGNPSTDLVTAYTFWTPASTSDANYAQKKLTVRPDGSWLARYVTRTTGTGVGAGATLTAGGGAPTDGHDLITHEFSPLMNQAPPASTATTGDLDGLKASGRYVKTRYRADYRQEQQEYLQNKLVSQSLPGPGSVDGQEVTCSFSDSTHYFATFVQKDSGLFFTGLPSNIYQLKENLQEYSLTGDGRPNPADIISHTAFFRATATATETFPYYSTSGGASGTDPYRVTDFLFDPERLPCRMTRTVVDRLTGNEIAIENYVVTAVDWWGNPESKILLDSKAWTRNADGLPLTLTYLDGRSETWTYDSASQVTWKNDKDIVTVQIFDEFGRIVTRAAKGVAAYSYSGALGSASLPSQQYWDVTSWSYQGRGGNILTGTSAAITTSARDGGLTGTVASTGSVSWQRSRSVETDGAGRTVNSTNVLGRTDYWHYSVASGGGEIVRHSLSSSPTAPLPLEAEERYRDGTVNSVTGTAVTDTWYTYGAAADWRERKSMGFDASLTATLGVRSTETDGLGRIVKITQPRSSTGTTLNGALDETLSYNNEGLLASRQIPGSTAGTFYYDLYSYAWSGGSSTESPHRAVTSVRSADGTLSDTDTSRMVTETWLESSSGLWWETKAQKVGLGADTASVSRTAVGPMNLTSGYSRVKITSLGTTEERITARIASGAVHETKHTRNGSLVGGLLLRNGLPAFVRQNITQKITATFSPLREPLMEPDSASAYWITRTLDPGNGLVTQRVGPQTGESLQYYTGSDHRTGRLKKRIPLASDQGPVQFDYNAGGQIVAQWGSGTYPAAYEYDEWMRQTKLTTFRNATGQTVDPDTNPAAWTPVISATAAASTVWAYPPWLDLVISKTYAAGSPAAVTYTYHQNGQLKTRTGQRSLTTSYTYNSTGQLQLIDYPGTDTPDVSFVWDTAGRNSGRTDGAGTWTLTYAADGRLLKETTGATARSNEWTLDSYGFKAQLNSQYNSSAVAPAVNYAFNTTGLFSYASSGAFGAGGYYEDESFRGHYFSYTAGGPMVMDHQISIQKWGDNLGEVGGVSATAYGEKIYDPNYEEPLQEVKTVLSAGYIYTYGKLSSAQELNWMPPSEWGKWKYAYDSRSQVKKAYREYLSSPQQVVAGTQSEYIYDLIGNRIQWKEGGASTLGSGLRSHNYGGTSTAPTSPAAAGDSANSLNQYLSISRPQAFDVTGNRATGSSTVSVTAPPASAATPAFQQDSSTGLYFSREVAHASSTNGKYAPVTVSVGGTVTDSWQQYVPPAAEVLTYDEDGNLLTDGRWSYTWDAENRLIKMETAAQTGTNPLPGMRLVFSYDGLSRRCKKEVYSTQPSSWTLTLREHYVYDGWNLVLTARENNAPTPVVKRHACYVWGPDIGSMPFGNRDWQRAGGVGGLLMVIDGVDSSLPYQNVDYNGSASPPADPTDDNYFPGMDRLGNVRTLVKASVAEGVVAPALIDYDAFGRELRSTGRAADIVPFHFSTKFTDPETGLNYYGYRFYDPVNGRWINRDPIGERGGRNLYNTVEGNLVNYVDILGMELVVPEELKKEFDQARKYLNKCPEAKKLIDDLLDKEKTTKKIELTPTISTNNFNPMTKPDTDPGLQKLLPARIFWNPSLGFKDANCCRSPAMQLLHEMVHARDYNADAAQFAQDSKPYSNEEEKKAKGSPAESPAMSVENNAAKTLGEHGQRPTHSSPSYQLPAVPTPTTVPSR